MATIVSPRLVRFFLAVVIWIAATEFAESQIHVGSGSGDQVSGFMCEGGEVIYDHFQCDGILDCYDGSDEQNCPIKCPLQFRCHDNSQCIPKKAVCNKKIDCPDSSDEQYCNLFNYTVHPNQELVCLEHQMRCEDNTICIWESFWCDDETDCVDNSDEQNCDQYHSRFRVGAKCSSSQFQCSSGTCIPRLYLCDGQKDCHDDQVAADEAVCDGDDVVTNCTAGFLDCSNGLCVNVHRRCNGVDDCGNNEDERSCPVGCSGGVHCPVGGVLSCVPEYHKCDGLAECDNLEDEFDCGRVCPDDLFQCSSSITCIDPSRRCDGREDCVDGLDELICALAPPLLACEEDDVPCLDGRHCVETSAVCDGEVDCQDESDEHEYCDPELMMDCDEDNGGCEHICHSVGSHSVGNHSFCSCIHGYVLNTTDFQSCQDVDECSQPGTCRQLCTNTEGSYSCSCAPGYVEAASGYGCRATGPRAFLLFSNRVDIQRVAVRRGRERHLLVKQLTYASDVEYHYKRDLLFWSDQREGVIMMASLSNTSDKSVLINSLKSPSGLAVDWVSDKLYWADSEAGVIEVASLDGRRRKRLISTNIDRPKAIVLDPIARYTRPENSYAMGSTVMKAFRNKRFKK